MLVFLLVSRDFEDRKQQSLSILSNNCGSAPSTTSCSQMFAVVAGERHDSFTSHIGIERANLARRAA